MDPDAVRDFLERLAGGAHSLTLGSADGRFLLACFLGSKPVALADFVKEHQLGEELEWLLDQVGSAVVVPLGRMEALRETLMQLPSADVAVWLSPEAVRFTAVPAPPHFSVSYDWDAEAGGLVRHTSEDADYYGDGWFLSGDRGWRLAGVTPDDCAWLGRESIAGEDILRFVGEVAAGWDERPIACQCTVRCDPEPVQTLHIRAVSDATVDVAVTWNVAPGAVSQIRDLPGYVVARGTVRPGLTAEALAQYLPDENDVTRLVGQQVPRFMRDVWPRLRAGADGEVGELERRHTVITAPVTLSLMVKNERHGVVGHPVGVPVVRWGKTVVDAEPFSRTVRADRDFVRAPGGWLPAAAVPQAGIGPLGRRLGGEPLREMAISTLELLHGGSDRLVEHWPEMDFSAFQPPAGGSEAEAAVAHLHWLLEWGIPGGLLTRSPVGIDALATVLGELVQQDPSTRVLVVGPMPALGGRSGALARLATWRFESAKAEVPARGSFTGVVLATPAAVSALGSKLMQHWDVLCLVEADSLIKSRRSRLSRILAVLHASITLGVLDNDLFLNDLDALEPLAHLFDMPETYGFEEEWYCILRDPSAEWPGLPPAYREREEAKAEGTWESSWPGEFTLVINGPALASALPPRMAAIATASGTVVPEQRGMVNQQVQAFLAEARANVDRIEGPNEPVTFAAFRPTYDMLTPRQQRWYFYWREQARTGHYLATDPGYVFLYACELVNDIGVADAADGYERLRQLWLHYGKEPYRLGWELFTWLTDYGVVHGVGADPPATYAAAYLAGVDYVTADLPVTLYAARPFSEWPLALIEAISSYAVTESRLYSGPLQQALNEAIPKALDAVDRAIRASAGCSLLEVFCPQETERIARVPFRGAFYGGDADRVVIGETRPYSDHAPLHEFIGAVLKHTENCLRELHRQFGRLRSYTLDPEFAAVIEEVVLGRTPPASPTVRIDLAQAEVIARESDAVRDMLLAGQGEAAPQEVTAVTLPAAAVAAAPKSAAEQGDAGPRSAVSLGRQQRGDLPEEWATLAGRLAKDQIAALVAIAAQRDVASTLAAIAAAGATMPAMLVDSINELAIATVGDIIVDPAADPPALLEENAEAVRALIAAIT